MDILGLIPTPDAIPVAWGWLEVLLLATFIVHILLMNATVGGVMLCAARTVTAPTHPATSPIAKFLPTGLALTINFGVAPLLFVQMLYGQFMYTSSVIMAGWWLSIIFMLVAGYYGLYLFAYQRTHSKLARRIIWLSLFLLLVVSFLLSNNMTLMLQPERWVAYFSNPSGSVLNLADPTLFPRWMHFIVATVAIGGLFQAALLDWKSQKEQKQRTTSTCNCSNSSNESLIKSGMAIFRWLTLTQLLIGPLFLHSLPDRIQTLFLGGSHWYTGSLVISLAGVAMVLHFAFRNQVWPTVWATVFTVAAMSLMRAFLRTAYLAPYFTLNDLPVRPEYSPFILFLGCFVIGIGLIGYMLHLVKRNEDAANNGREV